MATQTSSPTEALPPTDASPLTEALEMTSRICIGLRLEIRGRKGYALIKLKVESVYLLVHSHRKYVIVRSTYVLFWSCMISGSPRLLHDGAALHHTMQQPWRYCTLSTLLFAL